MTHEEIELGEQERVDRLDHEDTILSERERDIRESLAVTPVLDTPEPVQEPVVEQPAPPLILKPRTMLRDTFKRLWQTGQMMQPEGILIAMLCPECHAMIQLGLDVEKKTTELRCNCTIWTIRSIHY